MELEAICLKCLEKSPGRRYSTASKLAADLHAFLEGKAAKVQPVRGLRRLGRGICRWPRLSVFCGFGLFAGLAAILVWYFAFSDRPLRQMQAHLSKNEAVEPIGAKGKPLYWRWWVGGDKATTGLESDGSFAVHGWPLTLVELLPTIDCSHYLIRAEVRHLNGVVYGDVGLFFAGDIHHAGNVPVLSFLHVSFNDRHDMALVDADRRAQLPPAVRKLAPVQKANRVSIDSHYYANGKDEPILDFRSNHVQPELFKPSGNDLKEGIWRKITVEVSPSKVRVYWEGGSLVGQLALASIEKVDGKSLAIQRKQKPDNPALVEPFPRLNPRGCMGLYVFGSSASFRNVRIEPFAPPANNK